MGDLRCVAVGTIICPPKGERPCRSILEAAAPVWNSPLSRGNVYENDKTFCGCTTGQESRLSFRFFSTPSRSGDATTCLRNLVVLRKMPINGPHRQTWRLSWLKLREAGAQAGEKRRSAALDQTLSMLATLLYEVGSVHLNEGL